MVNDRHYWDNFYKENHLTKSPSSFAIYLEKKYLQQGKSLLELGCGNGRDALFLSEKGCLVSALDLSTQTITHLKKMNVKNVDFYNQDFSDLSKYHDFDYVYSRFTFHAIDDHAEELVLNQLPKVLTKNGLFFLEARSKKDEKLCKNYGFTHFRRFLDFDQTITKIEDAGFRVLEKTESQGLSPYKTEDPYLIRIIAKKQ